MRPFRYGCLLALALLWPRPAASFCGFYVASGDAKLFNKASQVVLARDGDRTVLTMASDFQGDVKQFAVVVPVPTVLEKSQIHVGDQATVDHIDAFSAPRLVEYFDPSPCQVADNMALKMQVGARAAMPMSEMRRDAAKSLGVTIEAQYTVGEYDILILSAKQSFGLERWLTDNGYRVPAGASRVLETYLKQGMKFFVAKVNLAEQQKLGFRYLRPLQMAFTTPKFMLPIRLGMVNATGPQELFVYAITRRGRVECVNYRTVKLPTDAEVPEFVQADFKRFYRELFAHQVEKQPEPLVFTEYCWDMRWCDPCAAQPLSNDELRQLGAFWVDEANASAPVFLTRLHVRYDRARFPEDLAFQVTTDTQNFQGRYVIRHEWKGTEDCPGADAYRASLRERRHKQAETLADLTGWSLADLRKRMAVDADWSIDSDHPRWWERMWRK
jgi:hypothetical protein